MLARGDRLGPYEILSPLGAGGMGEVYRARDGRLGRDVALKVLPEAVAREPERLKRFEREARAMAALSHPNVLGVFDVGTEAGRAYLVCELLEGETLGMRMRRGRLPVAEALDLGAQAARGLAAAHAVGIVHRDVKPDNLFLTRPGVVKVLDFGLARLETEERIDGEHGASTLTGAGAVLGTASYMSPEQAKGLPLDARSDLFSLGAVLHEMLSGRHPFKRASLAETVSAILHDEPSTEDALPPGPDRVVRRCLEKQREKRFQSALDLEFALTSLAPPASAPSPPARRGGQRRAAAILAVLALTAAVVGYLAWSMRGRAGSAALTTGPRSLSRVTFEEGLQAQPTWSPDGRLLAYSSDQSGSVDIWVQPVAGGRAVQVTTDPASDWQPSWSPDGSTIAFRSERDGGGIFLVPALGGRERRLTSFGERPAWSPDGSRILLVVQAPFEDEPSTFGLEVYEVDPSGGTPQRIASDALAPFYNVGGVAWHPDGRRLVFAGDARSGERGIWTLPLPEGSPVRVPFAGEGARPMDKVQVGARPMDEVQVGPTTAFRWSADGAALYFVGRVREVQNLWRLPIDPRSERFLGPPERLTVGVGIDCDPALSPDGTRLAFVVKTQTRRIWSIPLDRHTGLAGTTGVPLTPPTTSVDGFDVSADGSELAFIADRAGRDVDELWLRSLEDDAETLLAEAPLLFAPRLSRDGSLLAYRITRRFDPLDIGLAWVSTRGGDEHPRHAGVVNAWDWSPDGERILHSCPAPQKIPTLCTSPREAPAGSDVRPVLIDPDHSVWQGRYSPDGRWICFVAQGVKKPDVMIVGVVPSSGGAWVPITEYRDWADKPRWAPDGRAIYFVSNRRGAFFDVWGIGFDPTSGRAVGEPFRVTRFDSPGRTLTANSDSELGVAPTSLVLPLTETSGSVWVLDGLRPGTKPPQ